MSLAPPSPCSTIQSRYTPSGTSNLAAPGATRSYRPASTSTTQLPAVRNALRSVSARPSTRARLPRPVSMCVAAEGPRKTSGRAVGERA